MDSFIFLMNDGSGGFVKEIFLLLDMLLMEFIYEVLEIKFNLINQIDDEEF